MFYCGEPHVFSPWQGWEMAFTPQGVPYFIDHKRKTTSWTGITLTAVIDLAF
jgi:hypothetical protein